MLSRHINNSHHLSIKKKKEIPFTLKCTICRFYCTEKGNTCRSLNYHNITGSVPLSISQIQPVPQGIYINSANFISSLIGEGYLAINWLTSLAITDQMKYAHT